MTDIKKVNLLGFITEKLIEFLESIARKKMSCQLQVIKWIHQKRRWKASTK